MSKPVVYILFCGALAGCLGPESEKDGYVPTKMDEYIPWEQAVSILYNRDVTDVGQYHNLEVTLYLKDGTSVKTIEPQIDAIFEEVEKCGRRCANLVIATE